MAVELSNLTFNDSNVGVNCANSDRVPRYVTLSYVVTNSSGTVAPASSPPEQIETNGSRNFSASHTAGPGVLRASATAAFAAFGRVTIP